MVTIVVLCNVEGVRSAKYVPHAHKHGGQFLIIKIKRGHKNSIERRAKYVPHAYMRGGQFLII